MQKINLFVLTILPVSFLTGCVSNPINAYTSQRYYEAGIQAEAAGDLTLARQNFYRAGVNVEWGALGPAAHASCLYEWSRVSGYLGKYDEAEKGFNEVLDLIKKSRGQADPLRIPTLCELARLLHDTEQHTKAIAIYEKAVTDLDQTTVLKDDPITYASFLEGYAQSLKAAGLEARAEEIQQRALTIRKDNPGLTAKFVPKRYK